MFGEDQVKKNRIWETILVPALLLLIGAAVFVYWSGKKEVWFCDEIYSYQSANGFEQGWPGEEYGKWMSGEEVQKFFSADWDKPALDYIGTTLYSDHVPLYFWLFRLVSYYGFHGSASLWIGFSINLFFYLTFLYVAYRCFLHLMKSAPLAAVATVVTCVGNRLILQQALTLRMYMMLLWAQLLLLVVGFWIWSERTRGRSKVLAFVALYAVSVFGFLTHYDFWIYYAVVAAVFCLRLLLRAVKKGKARFWKTTDFLTVLLWVGNFVAALLTELVAFKYSRWNLFRDKGAMAMDSLFDFSAKKFQQIRWGYDHLTIALFGEGFPGWIGWVLVFGCIMGGAFVLYKKRECGKMEIMLLSVLALQLYQLVVCFAMPGENVERYLWGSYTITFMASAWGAYLVIEQLAELSGRKFPEKKIFSRTKELLVCALALVVLLTQAKITDGGNGIIYLFHQGKDMAVLKENSQIPWVVYGPQGGAYSYFDWFLPEEICFLSGQDSVEEIMALEEVKDASELILYAGEASLEQAVEVLSRALDRQVQAEYLANSVNMNVYLIK